MVTLSRGNGENRSPGALTGIAMQEAGTSHYLGQALSPGKGKAGSWRQGEVLSWRGACDATWQQKAATKEASLVREEGWVNSLQWVSWDVISKTAQRSGYPSSRKQSLLSNFCQIPDQREVKWGQQYFMGWEDCLVQAWKTDLKKIKRARVSYRQFLCQDYLKGGGEKGRQII